MSRSFCNMFCWKWTDIHLMPFVFIHIFFQKNTISYGTKIVYVSCCNKIQVILLTSCRFLDADMCITQNTDHFYARFYASNEHTFYKNMTQVDRKNRNGCRCQAHNMPCHSHESWEERCNKTTRMQITF